MKTYSQKTIPIQVGKLGPPCPVCRLRYRLRVKTGVSVLYYHNDKIICQEFNDECPS